MASEWQFVDVRPDTGRWLFSPRPDPVAMFARAQIIETLKMLHVSTAMGRF